jgi:hypothetical protein
MGSIAPFPSTDLAIGIFNPKIILTISIAICPFETPFM